MLDIKLIREHSEIVKENQKKRGLSVAVVDNVLALDKKWKALKEEVDRLRNRRNKISEEINKAKKQGKAVDDLIKEAKTLPKLLEQKEQLCTQQYKARNALLMEIPNILDKSVPTGDATKNKILKKHGKISKYLAKSHADILEELDLLDTKKAGEVAGARFYYLKGDLVLLNQAIINFALNFLRKKGFVLMQPPFMLRRKAIAGAIPLDAFEEMIYKIDKEDLYLIGTAEHALNAYYSNSIIDAKKLPIRFAGISPCFRKEAGAHGKDTKGIFRVHQFEKVEQFVFCKPENAWKEFALILNNTETMFKQLGIPFRVVVLSSQETSKVAVKTVDLEGWFPSQKAYRELGSCSNCTDYQARRSNIKFIEKGKPKFVYTLNNTAIATERMMVCIIENNLQKDGSIKIPKVLWKYVPFKVIKKAK